MQTKRNKIAVLFVALTSLLLSATVSAQEYQFVDSLVYVPVASVDSTMMSVDVFDVDVHQSESIRQSMRNHISSNPSRHIAGYRVRIFFDNKQTARTESEATLKKFVSLFRDIPAYRTYTNPYFKITVGDCRTKSEAMALLNRIKKSFPSAFVVKENISYPPIDKNHVYDVDTVKVLKLVPSDVQ